MKKKRLKRMLICMITVLSVALLLPGCALEDKMQEAMQDDVSDDYLEDMLDAIEDEDADAAYDLFAEDCVDKKDIEKSMPRMNKLWDGGDYEYEMTYKGFRTSFSIGSAVKYNDRKYKITTEDSEYEVSLTYIEDEGLTSFYINL